MIPAPAESDSAYIITVYDPIAVGVNCEEAAIVSCSPEAKIKGTEDPENKFIPDPSSTSTFKVAD